MFFQTQGISMGGVKNKPKDKTKILKQLQQDRNRRLKEKMEAQASAKIQNAIRRCLASVREFDEEYNSNTIEKRIVSMNQLEQHLNNREKYQIACAKAFPFFFQLLIKFPPIRIRRNRKFVLQILKFIGIGASTSKCSLNNVQNWKLKTYQFFCLAFKFLLEPFFISKKFQKEVCFTVEKIFDYVLSQGQFKYWISKIVKEEFFMKKLSSILKQIQQSSEQIKQSIQFKIFKRILALELSIQNKEQIQLGIREARHLQLILRIPGSTFQKIIQESLKFCQSSYYNFIMRLYPVREQVQLFREDKSTISLIGNLIKLLTMYFFANHNKYQQSQILVKILQFIRITFSSKYKFIKSYLKDVKKKQNIKISRQLSGYLNPQEQDQYDQINTQHEQVKQPTSINYESDPRFFLAQKPIQKTVINKELEQHNKKPPHIYIPTFELQLQQLQKAMSSLNDDKLITSINSHLNLNNSALIDAYITILNFLSLFDQSMKQNLSHKFHNTLMHNQQLGIHLFQYVQSSTNLDFLRIINGSQDILSVFELLCNLYYHSLLVIDDFEFKGEAKSKQSIFNLQVDQLKPFAKFLNQVVLHMHTTYCNQYDLKSKYGSLPKVVKNLVNTIYQRQRRCQLFEPQFWLQNSIFIPKISLGSKIVYTLQLQNIIKNCPHCIPFQMRKLILSHLVKKSKQLANIDYHQMYSNYINIRRAFIIEDTFFRIRPLESQFRNIVNISFVDQFGNNQEGIDGGGLFKEFMTLFCRNIFNPQMGYFIQTPEHTLCPNPNHMHGSMRQKYFQTIGMIIGKAIFQGILIEPCISRVFLSKVQGKMNKADDLQYIDPVLHKNLLSLKRAENVSTFQIYFVISQDKFGKQVNIPLLPGGQDILVTDQNKSEYIYLIANYKLNIQMQEDAKSFKRGFDFIIPQGCLDLFNPDELLKLISGDTNGFQIQSLKENCKLSGYEQNDPQILKLWQILEGFDENQKGQFLLFVTGCSRPPLMVIIQNFFKCNQGFESLQPKLAIQKVDSKNNSLLPESATCVNLLRLPSYSNQTDMKTRLLIAMENSEGFGLA